MDLVIMTATSLRLCRPGLFPVGGDRVVPYELPTTTELPVEFEKVICV